MPKFSYVARSSEGQIKKGEIIAKSKDELAGILRSQGLLLTSAEADKDKKSFFSISNSSLLGRVSSMDKIIFTKNLYVMIKSGLSIMRALEILIRQTPKKSFKNVIMDIRNNIEKGTSFAESLKAHPKIFSPFYINMIQMGEVSGKLEEVLLDLAGQMKKDRDLIVKIRSAAMYPTAVLLTMVLVAILMIVLVLPQLTEIFKDFQVELPITTRILIGFSDIIQNYGLYVLIGLIIFGILMFFAAKSKDGKKVAHFLYVKLFILGPIIRKINLARFSRTLGTLLHSGVPIARALKITNDVLGNIYYKKIVTEAEEKIKRGVKMVDILEKDKKLFPPLTTQMIMVGEETGSLDDILEEIADFYEAEVTETMGNLSAIVEPVLMVILGLGVGIVAVSIIAPIYSIMEHF